MNKNYAYFWPEGELVFISTQRAVTVFGMFREGEAVGCTHNGIAVKQKSFDRVYAEGRLGEWVWKNAASRFSWINDYRDAWSRLLQTTVSAAVWAVFARLRGEKAARKVLGEV